MVKILPFGLEKSYGERSFKITEFKDGQFHVVLQATNSLLNKSVVKGISILEMLPGETEIVEEKQDFEATDTMKNPVRKKTMDFVVLVKALLVILILLIVVKNCFS